MKLLQIDSHRNGVCGIGFYVAIIQAEDKKFLVTEFDEDDNSTGGLLTSVICLDLLQKFHDFMVDVAIPEYEKQRDLELQKFIESRNAKTQEVSND